MPFAARSGTDINHSSPGQSSVLSPPPSGPRQLVKSLKSWAHKKYGWRKEPNPRFSSQGHLDKPASSTSGLKTVAKPSPRREEKKKKKRRESDAKCRSNLSVCFQHLETKVVKAQNCYKRKLSKEMIIQKTVEKVQYLEAVFMLLNQANGHGRKHEFSPLKGLANLQKARKDFALKFRSKSSHHKNAGKASSKSKKKRHSKNLVIQIPFPTLPCHSKKTADGQWKVSPSVASTAKQDDKVLKDDAADSPSHRPVMPPSERDCVVPCTPTNCKSLICDEQELPDDVYPTTPQPNDRRHRDGKRSYQEYKGTPYPSQDVSLYSTPKQSSKRSASLASLERDSTVIPAKSRKSISHIHRCPVSFSPTSKALVPSPVIGLERAVPHWSPYPSPTTSSRKTDRGSGHAVNEMAYLTPTPSPVRCRGSQSTSVDHSISMVPSMSHRFQSPSRTTSVDPSRNPVSTLTPIPSQVQWQVNHGASVDHSVSVVPSLSCHFQSPTRTPSLSPSWNHVTTLASGPSLVKRRASQTTSVHNSVSVVPSLRHRFQSQTRTPSVSPSRNHVTTLASSPYDLVISSPSRRYKIVGESITSLGNSEPGDSLEFASLADSKPDESGRATPDLICQEEIPSWKDDDKCQKSTSYLTPHSSTRPFPVPPKKRSSAWSARYINDVRHCQGNFQSVPSITSKRCRRLTFDSDDEYADDLELKKKKTNSSTSSSPIKLRVRRKYQKRATAARIRAWDPVANKVQSPVSETSRKYSQSQDFKTSTSWSITRHPYHQLSSDDAASCFKPRSSWSRLKPRAIFPDTPKIVVEDDSHADSEVGQILDVVGMEPDWSDEEEHSRKRQDDLFTPDDDVSSSSPVDQDYNSSQGSLLLSGIPQLPDDIITPLLTCCETGQCFLEPADLEETLRQQSYLTSDMKKSPRISKSDDEIVLTILELEEESRSSSSTRVSPDSTAADMQNLHPTSDTSSTYTDGNDIVDVMEVMTADQDRFPSQLQRALLEAYQLMSCEPAYTGSPPSSLIISPVRVAQLPNPWDEECSPTKTSFYLVSPVKNSEENICLRVGEPNKVPDDGKRISESMARFASGALSSDTLKDDQAILDSDSSDTDVYRGDTRALLNGKIVDKSAACIRFTCRPRPTLICINSGTPSKTENQLPYSSPSATLSTQTVMRLFDKDLDVNPNTRLDAMNLTPATRFDAMNLTPATKFDAMNPTPATMFDTMNFTPATTFDVMNLTPATTFDAMDPTPATRFDAMDPTSATRFDTMNPTPATRFDAMDPTPATRFNAMNPSPATRFNAMNPSPATNFVARNHTPASGFDAMNPTSDTDFAVQSQSALTRPADPPSTPGDNTSLGCWSESTADASFSSELSEELAFRLPPSPLESPRAPLWQLNSQPTSSHSAIKKEPLWELNSPPSSPRLVINEESPSETNSPLSQSLQSPVIKEELHWKWNSPSVSKDPYWQWNSPGQTVDLEADETLDDLVCNELSRYYPTYDGLKTEPASGQMDNRDSRMEVPDWHSKAMAGRSSKPDNLSTASPVSSISMANRMNISQDSIFTDSQLSSEFQVVPSLVIDEDNY